jgi:hypothetical protein
LPWSFSGATPMESYFLGFDVLPEWFWVVVL